MWHSRKYYSSDVFTLLQILRCQGRACRTQHAHDAHSLLYSHPIKSDQSIFAEPITLPPDWVDSPHSTPSSHAAAKQTFTSQNDLLELVSLILKGQRSNVCLLGSLVCSIKGLEGSAAVIWCKPECCAEVRRTTRAFCAQGPTKSLHTLTRRSDFLKWMLLN